MIIDDFFVKLLSVDFFSLSFIKELLISSSEPASSKVGFNSSKFIISVVLIFSSDSELVKKKTKICER